MLNKNEIKCLQDLYKELVSHSKDRHDGEWWDEDLSDVVRWCGSHPRLKHIMGLATPKDLNDFDEGPGAIYSAERGDDAQPGCTYDEFVDYLASVIQDAKSGKPITEFFQ